MCRLKNDMKICKLKKDLDYLILVFDLVYINFLLKILVVDDLSLELFFCFLHIEKLDPSSVAFPEKILDKKLLLKFKKSKYAADKKNESWQNKRFTKKVF